MSVQSSSSTPHFSLCMISVIHAMSTGQHPVHRSSHYFTSRLVLSLLGHKMTDLPLEPQLAKMLLISPEYSCSNEVQRVGPLPLLCTLLLFLFSTLFCSVLLFFSLPFLFSSLLYSSLSFDFYSIWYFSKYIFSTNFPFIPQTLLHSLFTFATSPTYSRADAVHRCDALIRVHFHAAQRSSQAGEQAPHSKCTRYLSISAHCWFQLITLMFRFKLSWVQLKLIGEINVRELLSA